MFSFTGHTNSIWYSSPKNLPTVIESFALVPTDGNVTVNVYKIVPPNLYRIAEANLAINSGDIYTSERPVVLLVTEQIKIHSSGELDFDFTMNNIKP